MAVVGLIDDDRLYLKSTAGDAQPGASHDRLHSFCDASLRAPNPRMMVVPGELGVGLAVPPTIAGAAGRWQAGAGCWAWRHGPAAVAGCVHGGLVDGG